MKNASESQSGEERERISQPLVLPEIILPIVIPERAIVLLDRTYERHQSEFMLLPSAAAQQTLEDKHNGLVEGFRNGNIGQVAYYAKKLYEAGDIEISTAARIVLDTYEIDIRKRGEVPLRNRLALKRLDKELEEWASAYLKTPEQENEFSPLLCIRHSLQEYGASRLNFAHGLGMFGEYQDRMEFESLLFGEERVKNRWKKVDARVADAINKAWKMGMERNNSNVVLEELQKLLGEDQVQRVLNSLYNVGQERQLVSIYSGNLAEYQADRLSRKDAILKKEDSHFYLLLKKDDNIQRIDISSLYQQDPDVVREAFADLYSTYELQHVADTVTGNLKAHKESLEKLLPREGVIANLVSYKTKPERALHILKVLSSLPHDRNNDIRYDIHKLAADINYQYGSLRHKVYCEGMSTGTKAKLKPYTDMIDVFMGIQNRPDLSEYNLGNADFGSLSTVYNQFRNVAENPWGYSRYNSEINIGIANNNMLLARASEGFYKIATEEGNRAQLENALKQEDPRLYADYQHVKEIVTGKSFQEIMRFPVLQTLEQAEERFALAESLISTAPYTSISTTQSTFDTYFKTEFTSERGSITRFKDERLREVCMLMALATGESKLTASLAEKLQQKYKEKIDAAEASLQKNEERQRQHAYFLEATGLPENIDDRIINLLDKFGLKEARAVFGTLFHILAIDSFTGGELLTSKSLALQEFLQQIYPNVNRDLFTEFRTTDFFRRRRR